VRHYFADSGGRSVGIVRLRTKATEFSFNMIGEIRMEETDLEAQVER
jgi:hypothetical protein